MASALSREHRTRRFRILARTGYATNGLLHILIGTIATRVAFGDTSDRDADQNGALSALASSSGGHTLLWAAFAGLVALGVWQIVHSAVVEGSRLAQRLFRRGVEVAKGATYLVLAGSTLVFALGGSLSSTDGIRATTARLLASDPGTFVLVILGLSFVGSGIGFVVIGSRRGFRKLIRVPGGWLGRAVTLLGVSGYIAKGIALAAIGALFVVAAATGDGQQASGLDGALRALANLPSGPIVLTVIAVGLIGYGLFLVARGKLAVL